VVPPGTSKERYRGSLKQKQVSPGEAAAIKRL